MKHRQVGDVFVRKFKAVALVRARKCTICIFENWNGKGECSQEHKCVPSFREDEESVAYVDVTDFLCDADKLLIERGLLTEVSEESLAKIKSRPKACQTP